MRFRNMPNDEPAKLTLASSIAARNQGPPTLLDQVRNTFRMLRNSKRTEEAYVVWIRRYLLFAKARHDDWIHPARLDNNDINAFLTMLAVERKVAASTQHQAFSALLFLYNRVLKMKITIDAVRAKTPERLPVVLSVSEVKKILSEIPEGLHNHDLHSRQYAG